MLSNANAGNCVSRHPCFFSSIEHHLRHLFQIFVFVLVSSVSFSIRLAMLCLFFIASASLILNFIFRTDSQNQISNQFSSFLVRLN